MPPRQYRKLPIVIGGILAFAFSTSASHLYVSISRSPSADLSLPAQDADVSDRYDNTAATFDHNVESYEQFSFINSWRKVLARGATGHVLEVSIGTGRNAAFYDLKKCQSFTFVDRSGPMLDIAKKKFMRSHPEYNKDALSQPPVIFLTQSALEPLPQDATTEVRKQGGYDTILQTMGLCSTPQPTQLLIHLGTIAHPKHGKILLLEHGRSYYDWLNNILDKTAAERADKQGCWWNRDIGSIVENSGLVVDRIQRKHFGTLWIVEARPKSSNDAENGKHGSQKMTGDGDGAS